METAVCDDAILPTSVCKPDTMKDTRQSGETDSNLLFLFDGFTHSSALSKQKKKQPKTQICFLPDTVEDVAIRVYPQHDVLHGCVVDERALRVDEEHVRNPDLLDQTGVKGTTLVAAGGEGQAVVLPVMSQVKSHGEVLETRAEQTGLAQN